VDDTRTRHASVSTVVRRSIEDVIKIDVTVAVVVDGTSQHG
jgi:hypothetical protein